ncbi:DUF1801 domain-containing protein [Rathayibacter sp. ZW T2_19]|uniref:DUF1801 domain-containing protein n=1 Tax=Rathayibacter rubneri TaxID=2950106 RepID=A0A9X2ISL7_9MICO|nr:DUF1801 domain-containing protein [Rathayibacter rubneri]MCM6762057.1 DUF1801 domain-containing protein [Rathayibacter rubneri]
MTPSDEIDALIARTPDWRGETLAELRRVVRAADPGIVEEWKWMGAPVWELDGILCVGNVFRAKVKLGFLHGASLPDPQGIFNGELGGNQRRSVEFAEGDRVDADALTALVQEAIALNRRRVGERAAAAVAKREAARAARAAAKL